MTELERARAKLAQAARAAYAFKQTMVPTAQEQAMLLELEIVRSEAQREVERLQQRAALAND